MRKIALCSLPLLLSFGAAFAADVPQAGQPAPAVTLPSQDGTPVSLKEFSGKWVVLYFYPKDMTQGCTIEAHNFQRDLAKYQAANAVVLGVSVDSANSHKDFCAKENLQFKLLSDSDAKVSTESTLTPRITAFAWSYLARSRWKLWASMVQPCVMSLG